MCNFQCAVVLELLLCPKSKGPFTKWSLQHISSCCLVGFKWQPDACCLFLSFHFSLLPLHCNVFFHSFLLPSAMSLVFLFSLLLNMASLFPLALSMTQLLYFIFLILLNSFFLTFSHMTFLLVYQTKCACSSTPQGPTALLLKIQQDTPSAVRKPLGPPRQCSCMEKILNWHKAIKSIHKHWPFLAMEYRICLV